METRDAPKLRRVRRLDSIRLDKNDSTYFTNEGYLVDHPILTSCGIFEYTNPDGSIRRELRLPKYVFDENSLKTYRGKPIIITHDAGVVDKNNVDKEQIGTILSDGYEDGEDVRAEIIIHDTDSMQKCGLKELSLGYNLDLIEEPGVWNGQPYDAIQTNIVINHLALVASARAGEQAIEMETGLKEFDPPRVLTSEVHLRQVFMNIISNAIKYMDKPKGIIQIRIKDVGDFIQVEIEDNGKGIAAKDLPSIFDRFYRTDVSRNSSKGGSGIGLSIVKKILEDHGGKVWATSRLGIGTIMYFVLRKYQEVPMK